MCRGSAPAGPRPFEGSRVTARGQVCQVRAPLESMPTPRRGVAMAQHANSRRSSARPALLVCRSIPASRFAGGWEDFQSCAFPGKRVRAIGAGDGFGDLSGPADALRPVPSAVTERGYGAEEGHARPLKEGERAGHLAGIVEEGDQRCFYCVALGEV